MWPVDVEVGRELDAQQAVLVDQRDRDRADRRRRLVAGRPHLHAAVELDVERTPVVGDVDLHRGVRVVVERDLLEVGGDRRHGARVLAAVAGDAGGRLQAAEQVIEEVGVGERRGGVAHGRVPGAAAVEVGAPRDRVVVVDAVAVVLAVGRLVDGREDVHLAGTRAVVGDRRVAVHRGRDRVLEVVPLVRARPARPGRRWWRARPRPRCRRSRWACRRGGCGSSRRRARRTRASCTPCPRPRGCRRSRRRSGCSSRRPSAAASSRTSPVVERNTTTSNWARFWSVKAARVLRGGDREAVRRAEGLDGGDALIDRVVAEATGLGEHEHVRQLGGLLDRDAARHRGRVDRAHERVGAGRRRTSPRRAPIRGRASWSPGWSSCRRWR